MASIVDYPYIDRSIETHGEQASPLEVAEMHGRLLELGLNVFVIENDNITDRRVLVGGLDTDESEYEYFGHEPGFTISYAESPMGFIMEWVVEMDDAFNRRDNDPTISDAFDNIDEVVDYISAYLSEYQLSQSELALRSSMTPDAFDLFSASRDSGLLLDQLNALEKKGLISSDVLEKFEQVYSQLKTE
jgi:hypothetical protein